MIIGKSYQTATKPSQNLSFGAEVSVSREAKELLKEEWNKHYTEYCEGADKRNAVNTDHFSPFNNSAKLFNTFNADEFYEDFEKELKDKTEYIPGTIKMQVIHGKPFITFDPNIKPLKHETSDSGKQRKPLWIEGSSKTSNTLFPASILPSAMSGDEAKPQVEGVIEVLADLEENSEKNGNLTGSHFRNLSKRMKRDQGILKS